MKVKKENLIFRFATEEDAEKILKIYKPYVENTTITFEYEVPSIDEFKGRIRKISEKYPYIVCECGNEIAGYAYAYKIWSRAAYQWDAELTLDLKRLHILKMQGINLENGLVLPGLKRLLMSILIILSQLEKYQKLMKLN